MIDITQEIRSTGGIIPAITLKCARLMREHLEGEGITLGEIRGARTKIQRILTHADPHIDEYMAALVLRAVLPEGKKLIPLEETYLSSVNNDTRAKASWPESILLGFGGTHNGGAKPALLLDEHQSDEQQQSGTKKAKSDSVTQMVCRMFLKGKMSPAMYHLIREVDHIDSHGGAHDQNLGNYIKRIHGTDIFAGFDADGNVKNDRMDSSWKEASIYACIIALLMAEKDKLMYFADWYWKKQVKRDVEASLKFYSEHSAHKDSPEFEQVYKQMIFLCIKGFMADIEKGKAFLTADNGDGKRSPLRDKKGNELRQVMLMPYIASLCRTYWGEKLANIIMFTFWETKVQQNMTRNMCMNAINAVVKAHPGESVLNEPTDAGQVSVLYSGYEVEAGGRKYPVVLIDVSSTVPARDGMNGVLNSPKFNKVGYTLFRNLDKNRPALVFAKGANTPPEAWEFIVGELLKRDGSSDSRKRLGKWHVVRDANDNIATFILNGNAAHKYVQKVTRSPSGFLELIKKAYAQIQA